MEIVVNSNDNAEEQNFSSTDCLTFDSSQGFSAESCQDLSVEFSQCLTAEASERLTTESHCCQESEEAEKDVFDIETMKYELPSIEAEKVFRVFDDMIRKVEIFGLLVYLSNKELTPDIEVPDYVEESTQKYLQMVKDIAGRKEHCEKTGCMALLKGFPLSRILIKRWTSMPWDLPCSLTSDLSGKPAEFGRHLRKFQIIATEKMVKPPEQDLEERKRIRKLKALSLEYFQKIRSLEEELKTARESKELKMKCRKAIMQELKEEIDRIEWLAADNITSLRKAADIKMSKDRKESEANIIQLAQEVESLVNQCTAVYRANTEWQTKLRQRKRMVRDNVSLLIDEYDVEMGDRQSRYDYLWRLYTQELEKSADLESRVGSLKERYDVIIKEMMIKAEEQERLEAEMAEKTTAAIVIQACWRRYWKKKALKGPEKGKGGKKGGKRGGKGGGKGKKKK